jgi:hypothetical protein
VSGVFEVLTANLAMLQPRLVEAQ